MLFKLEWDSQGNLIEQTVPDAPVSVGWATACAGPEHRPNRDLPMLNDTYTCRYCAQLIDQTRRR